MKSLPQIDDHLFLSDQIDPSTKSLFEYFVELSALATKNNKIVLANGGFAVELALGRMTRNHSDLDLIAVEDNLEWLREEISKAGYAIGVHKGQSQKYTFTGTKEDLNLDVGSIGVKGNVVFDREEGGDIWAWPIKYDELIYSRNYNGVALKFVSPVLIYDFKVRQGKKDVLRQKDSEDLARLKEMFPELKNYQI